LDHESLEFPPEIIDFFGKRIPREMIEVYRVIWNHRNDGIKWTDLVQAIGDRYKVEKALLVLETIGFVSVETTINKREKKYVPHGFRGIQLAQYIRDNNY
jgi:hypothetical protein